MVNVMKQAAVNVLVGVGAGIVLANAYLAYSVHQVSAELEQVKLATAEVKNTVDNNSTAVQQIRSETVKIKQTAIQTKNEIKQVKRALVYQTKNRTTLSNADFECLARNVFYEAGVESLEGKLSVVQVTINRWHSGMYGNTVCQAVYAPGQFSWTADRKKRWYRPKGQLWLDSVEAVKKFTNQGLRVRGIEDSSHYHANWIRKPKWAYEMAVSEQIGQHVFYR